MGCTVLSGRIHTWHELLREPWAEWFENGLSAHFLLFSFSSRNSSHVTNGRREWNQMQISIGFCARLAVQMNPCINAFIIVFSVYDSGTCFSPAILDITDDDLRAKFMEVGTKHIQLCCILFGMSCYVKPGKIGRPIWGMKPWCLNLDVSNDDRLSLQSYKLANSSNCPKHFVVIGISDDTWYHNKDTTNINVKVKPSSSVIFS